MLLIDIRSTNASAAEFILYRLKLYLAGRHHHTDLLVGIPIIFIGHRTRLITRSTHDLSQPLIFCQRRWRSPKVARREEKSLLQYQRFQRLNSSVTTGPSLMLHLQVSSGLPVRYVYLGTRVVPPATQ